MSDEQDSWFKNAFGFDLPTALARVEVPPAPTRAAKGEIGHVAPYSRQGPAGYGEDDKRNTEHEHVIPRGKQEAVTFDSTTGTSDYTDAHYRRNTSLRVERDTSLNKTHANRGGQTADNAGTDRLKAKANQNDPKHGIDYREEVFNESVDNMKRAARDTGSRVTEAQIHETALAQDGELFGIQRMKDTGARIGATKDDVDAAIARLDFGDDEAAKLRRSIEASRKQAQEKLAQVHAVGAALEKKIAAANGAEKKELTGKRALLQQRNDEAVGAIERADADLEALANPSTRREELVAIKARRGSGGSMAADVEVDSAGKLTPGKATSRDTTVTTTSLDNGKATVEKTRSATELGADGVSSTQSHDKVVTSKDGVERTRASKTSKVSLTGKASVETKASHEVELADGRKAGVEASTTKEFSAGGASKTTTATTKALDGSSRSNTSKQTVEHDDGKITATTSRSVTDTNAKGTAVTREGSASGGVVSGKDGTGAQGNLQGGRKVTSKGGTQAGVVGGLHANVLCKVGEATGDPKRYPVSLTVSFGGSIAVSGGAGKKEGSKASANVEVKGSLEKSMTVTHMLGEAELGDYVKSLEVASKGNKVAATHNEFAIIAAGAKEGWSVARNMWQGISKNTADSLKRAGDSIEVSEKTTKGVAVDGNVKGVGAAYSNTETDETSKKMARNEKGTLDVEGKGANTKEKSLSVSLDAGVVGASVGRTYTHQTRFGFAIEIDPKDDPDGSMIAELAKCKQKAEYRFFLATHPLARMISKTEGQSDAERSDVGFSVGGQKVISLSTNQGVDEDVKTDAEGKVLAKRVAGHAGAGGKLGGLADSVEEDAVAEVDEDGNASLTMTRTTKDNHNSRAREKLGRKWQAQLQGKSADKASGAVTDAAGGEEDDTTTHDVSGITLSNKDLKRLGGIACRSMGAWMNVPRRSDEKADWKKAGQAIAQAKAKPSVVAEQLARFVGGDWLERMKTLELFIRGGYHQTAGKRFEFPDSLRNVRDDYNLVTDDGLDGRMNAFANKKGNPAAAEECKRLLAIGDKIEPKIQACNEFANQATKMEMLKDLHESRSMLARGIKGYGGDLKADIDPKILAAEGERLMTLCTTYYGEQMQLVNKMQSQDAYTVSERTDGLRLIKQLEDMQYRWRGDWFRLKDNYAKRKLPFLDMPHIKPQEELVATFEKKFRP